MRSLHLSPDFHLHVCPPETVPYFILLTLLSFWHQPSGFHERKHGNCEKKNHRKNKMRDINKHGEIRRKNHIRKILQNTEYAGNRDGSQQDNPHIGRPCQPECMSSHEKISSYAVREDGKEQNGADVMEIMRDKELGQPAQPRYVRNIISLENRHLSEAGEAHHKDDEDVCPGDILMFWKKVLIHFSAYSPFSEDALMFLAAL